MFVAVVVVGLGLGWVFRSGDPAIAQVGQPAPDFTAQVIDGGEFTLSDELGGPVVLNFWASWCIPCRTEIPDISAFATARPDVHVIGVAVEDVEASSREFAAQVDATYPLALGTEAIEDAYPRIGLPATYIISADGTVTHIFNGIVDEATLTEAVG